MKSSHDYGYNAPDVSRPETKGCSEKGKMVMWRVLYAVCGLLAGSFVGVALTSPPENEGDVGTRLNRLIEILERDQPAFGIFSAGASARNAVALSRSSLDFVLIDMEHAPVDFERLRLLFLAMVDKERALEKGNAQPDVVPIVRLPQNGREGLQHLIKQALDLGAYGLMLPHIETAAEALAAVRAARYPQVRGAKDAEPVGQRGSGYGFAAHVWGVPGQEYLRRADLWPHDKAGDLLLILQIESKRGVDNIEEILAVPGVGAIFVGPADLSMSLGVPQGHVDLEAAIEAVVQATKARRIPCGITAKTATVERRLEQGFQLLTLGNDLGFTKNVEVGIETGRRRAAQQ